MARSATSSSAAAPTVAPPRHEHTVLVLQGGGALGAYQAGAFEAFAAAGAMPDWIAGVSIGAINGALIAGNPPERRAARLREFWDRVSALLPVVTPERLAPLRPWLNRWSAAAATTFGIPGFFRPHPPIFAWAGLSVYDTAPLKQTLRELVDFELLNKGPVRLSVGAVNVRTGNSCYFDNTKARLGPEHIMASGALPPGFPPVEIAGELYWDGGIVSNSPLWYVLDEAPGIDALILQVDLFSARGAAPTDLDAVLERSKDIQYSSKTRFNSTQLRQRMEMKAAFRRLFDKLPAALRGDADAEFLASASEHSEVSLVQLINRHDTRSSSFKDYEFSRATVNELWQAGAQDVRRTVTHPQWCRATEHHGGLREFDLTR
jgi:NTE family protein